MSISGQLGSIEKLLFSIEVDQSKANANIQSFLRGTNAGISNLDKHLTHMVQSSHRAEMGLFALYNQIGRTNQQMARMHMTMMKMRNGGGGGGGGDRGSFLDSLIGGPGSFTRFAVKGAAIMTIGTGFMMANKAMNLAINTSFALGRSFSSLTQEVARLGASYEMTLISFEVMVGKGPEAAKRMVDSIEDFAIKSPYNAEALNKNAELMLGMGVSEENILPSMKALGEIAAGNTEKLGRLTLAYAQVNAAGRFMGAELRQFAEAGLGIKDFAETAGISSMQLKANMEAGIVPATLVAQTLNRLTSEGGRFYNLMEKGNKTAIGSWNALIESIQRIGRKLGYDAIKEFNIADKLQKAAGFFENLMKYEKPVIEWGKKFLKWLDETSEYLKAGAAIVDQFFDPMLTGLDEAIPQWEQMSTITEKWAGSLLLDLGEILDASLRIAEMWSNLMLMTASARQTMRGLTDTALSYLPGMNTIRMGAHSIYGGYDNLAMMVRSLTQSRESDFATNLSRRARKAISDQGSAASVFMGSMIYAGVENAVKKVENKIGKINIEVQLSPEAMAKAVSIKKKLNDGFDDWTKFHRQVDILNEAFGWQKGSAWRNKRLSGLLSQEELSFGLAQEYFELERSLVDTTLKNNNPSLALAGSSQAQESINRSMQEKSMSVEDRIRQTLEASKELHQKQAEYQKKVAEILFNLAKEYNRKNKDANIRPTDMLAGIKVKRV